MPAYAQGVPRDYLTVAADASFTRGVDGTVTVTAKNGATGATKTTEGGTVALSALSPDGGDSLSPSTLALTAGVGTTAAAQFSGGSGTDSGAIRAVLSGYMDGVSGTVAIGNKYLDIAVAAGVVRSTNFTITVTAKLPGGATDTSGSGTVTLGFTSTDGLDSLTPATIELTAGVATTSTAQITGGSGVDTTTITATCAGYDDSSAATVYTSTFCDVCTSAAITITVNNAQTGEPFVSASAYTPDGVYTFICYTVDASYCVYRSPSNTSRYLNIDRNGPSVGKMTSLLFGENASQWGYRNGTLPVGTNGYMGDFASCTYWIPPTFPVDTPCSNGETVYVTW